MRFLAIVIVISLPVLAVAEETGCPDKPDTKKAQKKLAGKWFDKGEQLVEQEQYDAAVEAFQCSLVMVEHPSTLYNAAQAARLGGEHAVALDLLKHWLKISPYDEMTDEVVKQISELEEIVGPVEGPDEPLPDEGGGEYLPEGEAEQTDDDVGDSLVLAGWITFGVGTATAVTGAVLQGMAAKSEADAGSARKLGEFNDLAAKTDAFQKGAIAAFVVGGLALGAGVTMIILGSGGTADDPDEAVAVVPTHNGFVLSGRF